MTYIVIFLLLLATIAAVYFLGSARSSARMASPVLSGNDLPPCGKKPNCICSTANADSEHYVDAIAATDISMQVLEETVLATGGVVVNAENNLITATYTSALFGFIDDLLLHKHTDRIDVRSSSRVGYSDFNANRKRVEIIRQMISNKNSK